MVKTKQELTDYKRKFNDDNYVRIGLYVKPDLKTALEEHRATTGESMNAFINRAIRETIERDKGE